MDLQLHRLTQHAFGYWQSEALFALVETGLVDALESGPCTAERLAKELGGRVENVHVLCAAGVSLGVLAAVGGGFALSPLAERYLVADSPTSLRHWVQVMGRWRRPWVELAEAVLVPEGDSRPAHGLHLAADPSYERDFILGMHEFAALTAPDVVAAMGLEPGSHVIDVGGGAGTYAVAACLGREGVTAEVLDLPTVLPICEEVAAGSGVADRIRTRAADYRTDGFGTDDADVVLLSNVLHQEDEATCRSMLERAGAAARAGGRVVVHGHFLDEGRTEPQFAVLQALSALVLWSGGTGYTVGEVASLFEQAGLSSPSVTRVKASGTVVLSAPPFIGDAGDTTAMRVTEKTPVRGADGCASSG